MIYANGITFSPSNTLKKKTCPESIATPLRLMIETHKTATKSNGSWLLRGMGLLKSKSDLGALFDFYHDWLKPHRQLCLILKKEQGYRANDEKSPPFSKTFSCLSTDICKIYAVAYSLVDAGKQNSGGKKTLQVENDAFQGFAYSFTATENPECSTELFIPLQFSRSKLEGLQKLRSPTDKINEISAILSVLDRPFDIARDASHDSTHDSYCKTQLDAIGDYSGKLSGQFETINCTPKAHGGLIFIDSFLSYWHVKLNQKMFAILLNALESSNLSNLVPQGTLTIGQELARILNSR